LSSNQNLLRRTVLLASDETFEVCLHLISVTVGVKVEDTKWCTTMYHMTRYKVKVKVTWTWLRKLEILQYSTI